MSMTAVRLFCFAVLAWIAPLCGAAQAQGVIRDFFPPSFYDEPDPWRQMPQVSHPESLIQPVETDLINNRPTYFEPLSQMTGDVRALAESVGRMAILYVSDAGERGVLFCTATLVAPQIVLTARHCAPGNGAYRSDVRVERAKVTFGYSRPSIETDSYEVARVLEEDAALDYALLELEYPVELSPPLRFRRVLPFRAAEPLFIIHHPSTLPSRVTRYGCRSAPGLEPLPHRFYHVCSTSGASSGAPVFSTLNSALVGIHVNGGIGNNEAVPLADIYAASPLLRELAGGATGLGEAAPDGQAMFGWDSYALLPESLPTLDNLASVIRSRPPTSILIVGHTETAGSATYNVGLSQRRARAAADYLVSRGIDSGLISIDGQGEMVAMSALGADGLREPSFRRADVYLRYDGP